MAKKETAAKLPRHIAIIMDGNGRWAKKRLLPRTAGHKAGFNTFVDTVDYCNQLGIEVLTVYAFSAENWNRDEKEVEALMDLIGRGIKRYMPDLIEKNIQLHLIGDIERFAPAVRDMLYQSRERLASNTGMKLCICLSYGGRQEIVHAFNELAAEGKKDITAEDVSAHLYTKGLPDPDLVIRTSGEYRISNFLLWQSAYAEYYFADALWPDFGKKELEKALESYAKRERRFGR
ncbi:MAG: isoprenyl transferase [Clostridia bacterium]|nr:isoprenyl transferase [Clostridia bacterium]MBR4798659.1 isoprenyl transferase [Clostridia bacterium]